MQALIIFAAKYLFTLAPLLIIIVYLRLNTFERRSLLLRAIATAIFCAAFVHIGRQEYFDARPFALRHIQPLIPHLADNGFPAVRTLIAAACAFLLLPFARWAGIAATVAAIIVAFAQVSTLLHSPIDVIASIIAAAFAVAVVRLLVRRKPKTGKSFQGDK